MNVWHKKFSDLLNVVVIVKINLKTQAVAHVVLFSSNVELAYDALIDYYHLRFQIEFNFRDAKQYWGLEDFMTVKQTPVYNSANLAMFHGQCLPRRDASHAHALAGVKCNRSEGLVPEPQVCGGNLKIASGNARAHFY